MRRQKWELEAYRKLADMHLGKPATVEGEVSSGDEARLRFARKTGLMAEAAVERLEEEKPKEDEK